MAEKDTRFGGMMEVASSPTAKKEFQKEFKVYQDTKKDENRGGGDTGGGLVSQPVIETKKEIPIYKDERPTRFHKRKLEKKIAPVEKSDYLPGLLETQQQNTFLEIPQQNTFGILNNESFQEKTNNIIDAYIPQSFQNTLGVSYTLASAAMTGDINLEKQITDKSTLSFKVNDWGNDMALIFNLQLGG
jgi:hypothetical protein